ncbi:MAG: hypothetical protein ABUL64_02820 [Singulisphaera sp.]
MIDLARTMIEFAVVIVVIAVAGQLIAYSLRRKRHRFLAPLVGMLASVVIMGGWGSSHLARKQDWGGNVVLASPLIGLVAYGISVLMRRWAARPVSGDNNS